MKYRCLKKISGVEVIGRGGFILWKSNQIFKRFTDQLLRISPRFQALRVDEKDYHYRSFYYRKELWIS